MRTDALNEKMPSATVATVVIRHLMKHSNESNKPVGQLVIQKEGRMSKCF